MVRGLRGKNEPWVQFNRKLERIGFETARLRPERYILWALGGFVRTVGRLTLLNAPFLLFLIVWSIAYVYRVYGVGLSALPQRIAREDVLDAHALIAIVAIFTLSTIALPVLVTFPANRYISAAGLLLPALPLYGIFRLLAPINAARPAQA